MPSKLIPLLAAGLAVAAHAADVYKWTDAGGVVHYADTEPPAEAKAQLMHVGGGSTKSAMADNGFADAADNEVKKPPADTLVTAQAGLEERCKRARADLELLQSGTPVGLPGVGGAPPQPLDEPARRAQITNAQLVIAHNCR